MSDFTLIYDLTHQQAREYFFEPKHYSSIELPPYFDFGDILLSARAMLNGKNLSDICGRTAQGKPDWPHNYPGINYVVLSNKDGGFAWRPMSVLHPVVYADLVNAITTEASWKEACDFFREREKSLVECISIPLKSNVEQSSRAVAITNWWDRIEQESLRKSLDYRFMFQTDVLNCYPSIYTHSLEWAFAPGGRSEIKTKRANGENPKNLGTSIDTKIREMTQGQTIGIPQGSALMDLVAEIVLGGTDIELTEMIKSDGYFTAKKFKILRYRDDYRIFSDDYQAGHRIMKCLNQVLYDWNMKMNTAKTSDTSDLISASVKPEKLEELYLAPRELSFQKAAMRIYAISKKHPNSGLVAKHLTAFYDNLLRCKKGKKNNLDHEVIIAIIAMISYNSPKYVPQAAAVITRLIDLAGDKLDRRAIIGRIIGKFKDLPNTELIDIWLQRITNGDDMERHHFGSVITEVALGHGSGTDLWNCTWMELGDRQTLQSVDISTLPKQLEDELFSPIIEREEFELYRADYN